MPRPVDALITGFVKSPALAKMSLAPLLALRCDGLVRHIHYVTWDNPELDQYVEPLAAIPGLTLTRVAQPLVSGGGNLPGVIYQIENLKAALALVKDSDALVLKSRLDMVAGTGFLRRKIVNFERDTQVPPQLSPLGITMPAPVFRNKIWVPWADSNQPFFYEDAMFMGNAADIRMLAAPLTSTDTAVLADSDCGSYAHVLRFARPFVRRWPLFANYLRNYRSFVNDLDYRLQLVPMILDDGFFWHLLIAHAWILYSQFHVDAGELNDLRFFANNVNRDADWSRPETLRLANPYDDLLSWRNDTRPREATHSVRRVYGRLMDDAWPTALFNRAMPDFPRETLHGLMENVALCGDGRLSGIEAEFYKKLRGFRQRADTLKKTA